MGDTSTGGIDTVGPIIDPSDEASDDSAAATAPARPAVLVVEDDTKFGSLITRAFARHGLDTVHTVNGDAALRSIGTDVPFSAIVIDVMIPHPDGIEVCRHLRRHGSDVPIVAISARSSPEDRHRVRDAGADAFLAKPFALAELVELTKSLVAGRVASDPDRPPPSS